MSSSNDPFAGGGAAAPAVEFRQFPRHRVLQRCIARPEGVRGGEGWRGIVYDVSTGGVGIALPLPLRPGAVLEIEPWNLPGAKPLRARVVHAHRLEYIWLCGCQLQTRLRGEELQTWLTRAYSIVSAEG